MRQVQNTNIHPLTIRLINGYRLQDAGKSGNIGQCPTLTLSGGPAHTQTHLAQS